MTGADDDANRSSSSASTSSYSSSSTTDLRFLRAIISFVIQCDVLDGVAWNDLATARAGRGVQTHRVRAAVTNGRIMLDIVYIGISTVIGVIFGTSRFAWHVADVNDPLT